MTVSATSPTTTPARNSAASVGDAMSSQLDGSAFMKLLVAQLKNQDPNSPADPKDLITQLAQLTSVQELTQVNSGVASTNTAIAGLSNIQASSTVGRTIVASGNIVHLGQVGTAQVDYKLDGLAGGVKFTVTDAKGNVVKTATLGQTFPGNRTFTWDGNQDNGARAPQGTYTVSVSATDANGLPVTSSTDVQGVVTGISYTNGYPELIVGNRRITLGDIQTIEQ